MMVINKVIKGISKRLYDCTKYPVYVDKKTNNVHFPCFFLRVSDTSRNRIVGERYLQTHTFDIWYLPNEADEIKDVMNELHELAENLYFILEYIECEDFLIRGSDMSYRLTDGSFHFFVTYEVFLLKEKKQEEFMENLEVKGRINGE